MKPHVWATVMLLSLPVAATASAVVETDEPGQYGRAKPRENMRFGGMDSNRDGVITRAEWRGSDRSFRIHDWNADGMLSGDEVKPGATREIQDEDYDQMRRREYGNWTDAGFRNLDHNGDGRITRSEWHYDLEAFVRADRNRDGALTRAEFLGDGTDTDREDRFENLDANGNGRIERSEWHGSDDAFEWLDRNKDGRLSRAEAVGEDAAGPDVFASLDVNRDQRISTNEWHWSRGSFSKRDRNGDGFLSREELAEAGAGGTSGQVFLIDADRQWTDTGIDVRAGDVISLEASGSIVMSDNNSDVAGPAGAQRGRRAANAPLPQRPAGSLIARIGDSAPMLVGTSQVIDRFSGSGRLYLGVNDDHFPDNRGQYRVTVTVRKR